MLEDILISILEVENKFSASWSSITLQDDIENSPIQLNPSPMTVQPQEKCFEATLIADQIDVNIGIGVMSEKGKVVYMFSDGIIFTSDGSTYFGRSAQKEDVIGIRIIMNVHETEYQNYHHVMMYKNGENFGHPIILEGNNQISAVFVHEMEDKNFPIEDVIDLNFGEKSFNFKIGKQKFKPYHNFMTQYIKCR